MNLDNILWVAGSVAQAGVFGLLIYRRMWQKLPVFCTYSGWLLVSSGCGYAIRTLLPEWYLSAYVAETVIDSILEFAVLVELTWSVLRPAKASLPRSAIALVGLLILGLGSAIWPFASMAGYGDVPRQWYFLTHLQQTSSILRILYFLLLTGCNQLLSIGWRDRELQVATGLGFYSLVGLAVAMLHTHLATGQYNLLNQVELGSYVLSLLYWMVCFSQKEAERREFTPQMENLLLAMAGTARSTRIALVDSRASKSRNPDNR